MVEGWDLSLQLIANQALSQLSQRPEGKTRIVTDRAAADQTRPRGRSHREFVRPTIVHCGP